MSIRVAVLGLNRVGASAALALGVKNGIEVTAWDKRVDLVERAQKNNLPGAKKSLKDALKHARVVIFCQPLNKLQEVFKNAQPLLQPGVLLVDLSGYQVQPLTWARELFAGKMRFVSLFPAINPKYLYEKDDGPESAHADLFQNATIFVPDPAGETAAVIEAAVDLAVLLGGRPSFSDPYETEGVRAWVKTLPAVAAIVAAKSAFSQPGWREARKLAGDELAAVTDFVGDSFKVEDFYADAWLDKEATARVLDAIMLAAMKLKDALNQRDDHAFVSEIERLQEDRHDWLARRAKNDWDDIARTSSVPASEQALKHFLTLGG